MIFSRGSRPCACRSHRPEAEANPDHVRTHAQACRAQRPHAYTGTRSPGPRAQGQTTVHSHAATHSSTPTCTHTHAQAYARHAHVYTATQLLINAHARHGCSASPSPAEPQAHRKRPSLVAMVTRRLQPTFRGAGEKGDDLHSLARGRDRRGAGARTARPGGRKARPGTQCSPRAPGKGKKRGLLHQHPPWEQAFCRVTLRPPDNLCPFLI